MRWGKLVNPRAKATLVALAVLASGAVHAATEYKADSYRGRDASWADTKPITCASLNGDIPGGTSTMKQSISGASVDQYGNCAFTVTTTTTGSPNETTTSSVGFTQREKGTNECTANAGKTQVKNWTVGYTRSPDDNDYAMVGTINKLPGPGKAACFQGCTGTQGGTSDPGWAAWKSQSPTSEGLYRNSIDAPFSMTGEQCAAGTPGTTAVSPTVANPTCPGYVGEVNGKKGCYGTAAAPIIPTTVPPETSKAPAAGNPPAGDVSSSSTQQSGTARTPSAGSGGAAGGPAAAATGGRGGVGGGTTSGTGSVKAPATGDQQQNCGAPGQPVCDVKINEGDMPKEGTTFKDANEKLDDNAKATGDHITKIQNDESKPTWSFSFQLPTGCSPYQVASFKGTAFTMDPCAYQSTIHDLMSMVWAAATAFCLIGMVGRTLRST